MNGPYRISIYHIHIYMEYIYRYAYLYHSTLKIENLCIDNGSGKTFGRQFSHRNVVYSLLLSSTIVNSI